MDNRSTLTRAFRPALLALALMAAGAATLAVHQPAQAQTAPGPGVLQTGIIYKPDLTVLSTEFRTDSSGTYLRWTVKNIGTAASPAFWMQVKKPGVGPLPDQILQWMPSGGGLAAGATKVFQHKLPACVPYGMVQREIEVDAVQAISELNEGNNEKSANYIYGPSCP
jgi:hypothetical protein